MSKTLHASRLLAIPLAIVFAISQTLPWVAVAAGGADPDIFSYDANYKDSVAGICEAKWGPNDKGGSDGDSKGSLITAAKFSYPKIGDPAADDAYREGIKTVSGDLSNLDSILLSPADPQSFDFGRDVKAASEVYKERMSAVFACAQLNLKIRVHQNVMDTVVAKKATAGNTIRTLKAQNTALKQEMGRRNCADRTNTEGKSNLLLKSQVLRQTTYEYCNYRHYLQYLKFNSQSRVAKTLTAQREKKKNDTSSEVVSGNAEQLSSAISTYSAAIANEIEHTKNVFPQAMLAFNEFERNYPTHVIMLFILEDYVLLRDTLKKVMNPLGQVIYKASNAQSPYSP